METSDSRKRPLDVDTENGSIKRSNQGADSYAGAENVHLKVLIPSIAAGAIIGKGGETITQIQKETGANIKMSKANDFYPGTSERVCLITGSGESVQKVHNFIMARIRDKPDPNPKPVEGEMKVKILVPNTTAGMIIGKGGIYIRQIKDDSGAYVQISQKSKDMNLPERCITVAGDTEQVQVAVDMILQKIIEDPQSGSCPNISYSDIKGPVASSNPTGSPFANPPGGRMDISPNMAPNSMQNQPGGSGVYSNIGNSMNNLNLNSGSGNNMNNPALENLKATLRGSGYTEQAVEDISAALYTLANYGFLGLGLGLAGLGLGMGAGVAGTGQQQQQTNQANLTLANLATLFSGGNSGQTIGGASMGAGALTGGGGNALLGNSSTSTSGGSVNDNTPSVFGPAGSTTTTMAGGDTGEGSGSYFATASSINGDRSYGGGDSVFANSFNQGGGNGFSASSSGFAATTTNQNSFGLGTQMGGFPQVNPASPGSEVAMSGSDASPGKKDIEVGEYIVGAILGPGGRGIVELQKMTGANIQISKKGVFAPGTRNRVVSIAGSPSAVQRAQILIQQRIQQEETKRARQGHPQNIRQ